jgi:hypothetical protein
VVVDVQSQISWTLCVYPKNGWDPDWKGGSITAVVIIAFIVSLLTGLVLRSRDQAVHYLAQQKVWKWFSTGDCYSSRLEFS